MRVDKIEILPLRRTQPPFAGERGADDGQMHVILKLTTDDGALAIAQGPGLGLKWNSDGFERHCGQALTNA